MSRQQPWLPNPAVWFEHDLGIGPGFCKLLGDTEPDVVAGYDQRSLEEIACRHTLDSGVERRTLTQKFKELIGKLSRCGPELDSGLSAHDRGYYVVGSGSVFPPSPIQMG